MKGIIKKIEKREFKTKEGKKFCKIITTCDIIDEKGLVRTLKNDMNEEYAKRYYEFCGLTTRDAIGKEVECVIWKKTYRKEDETRYYSFIKYLNFLDEKGAPKIMRGEDNLELDF